MFQKHIWFLTTEITPDVASNFEDSEVNCKSYGKLHKNNMHLPSYDQLINLVSIAWISKCCRNSIPERFNTILEDLMIKYNPYKVSTCVATQKKDLQ